MKCEKCGKEIPEGENKICDDCKKSLLDDLKSEALENTEEVKEEKKEKKVEETKEDTKSDIDNKNEKKCCCKKKTILIIIVALLAFILAVICQIKFGTFDGVIDIVSENNVGNAVANVRNYGYVTSQGSWIYYVAPASESTDMAIYKAKKDGSKTKMLVYDNWEILGLNVKGDYLYFIALSEDENQSSASLESNESVDLLNNKIYRMKTDGTGLEVINSNEFHNNCYEIYVVGDKIFYIGLDANIWYMNLDGSNKTKLNSDETGYLGITDKYIIFNLKKENSSEENNEKTSEENAETEETEETEVSKFETCVMDLDGNNVKSLTGERLYSINICGDYIYYTNEKKNVYRVKFDGSENKLISGEYTVYNMNVTDKYIFYMNYTDENQNHVGIYRMDLDGENNKQICLLDSYSTFLNTVNGNVVYMDNSEDEMTINMIDCDGENRVKLYSYTIQDTESIIDESAINPVIDQENTETTETENNEAE